ncbi:unnamed protein product [Penicillium nalgiovense]|nr:unnamed protein product [Penicillium nalgiovense]
MYPTRMLRMQPTRAFYFPTPPTLSPSVCASSSVCPRAAPYRVAIGAAVYSSGKKLMTDKTLRLYRNSPESREH